MIPVIRNRAVPCAYAVMGIDWSGLFHPTLSLPEIFIRGTATYWFLFILLRILVRRHVGSYGLTDLLLIVLIADAAQNAMAGEYHTLTEGAALCGTIIGWSAFLEWIAFRSPTLRLWLEPPPLPLIQNGRLLRRNLAQELITEDELKGLLRERGVESISEVRFACVESDGELSVFKREMRRDQASAQRRRRAR